MAGRYRTPGKHSPSGPAYDVLEDALPHLDDDVSDGVDMTAPTDAPIGEPPTKNRTGRPKGRKDSRPRRPKGSLTPVVKSTTAPATGGATRGTASSAAIAEYAPRRIGPQVTERTRAAILSRVSPLKWLEHVAKGRPMLTTWVDAKSGETKEIWQRPSIDQRLRAAEIALDRVAPRLRAIEVSGETAHAYRLTVEDLRGILSTADPVTRELVEAEYEEMIGETPDNGPSRESGEP